MFANLRFFPLRIKGELAIYSLPALARVTWPTHGSFAEARDIALRMARDEQEAARIASLTNAVPLPLNRPLPTQCRLMPHIKEPWEQSHFRSQYLVDAQRPDESAQEREEGSKHEARRASPQT